jgi:hypothetical protein
VGSSPFWSGRLGPPPSQKPSASAPHSPQGRTPEGARGPSPSPRGPSPRSGPASRRCSPQKKQGGPFRKPETPRSHRPGAWSLVPPQHLLRGESPLPVPARFVARRKSPPGPRPRPAPASPDPPPGGAPQAVGPTAKGSAPPLRGPAPPRSHWRFLLHSPGRPAGAKEVGPAGPRSGAPPGASRPHRRRSRAVQPAPGTFPRLPLRPRAIRCWRARFLHPGPRSWLSTKQPALPAHPPYSLSTSSPPVSPGSRGPSRPSWG